MSKAIEIKCLQSLQNVALLIVPLIFVAALMWKPNEAFAAVSIPTPSWMNTSSIADKMVINGIPSTVHFFEADRKLDEVLGFYRQKWDESYADRAGYREVKATPWHVISRLEGRYLFTVQARKKNAFSTEGYLAIADLQEIEKEKPNDTSIPKMAGSRVINDMTSFDPGQTGRTTMIINDFSVSSNSGFYRDYYLNRNWGQLQDQTFMDAQVLAFRKYGRETHIVIRKSGNGSVMVMNQVETD